ncbi:hypothetical protein ACFC1T_04735 [Kitasatospora sp. NPDC056076]|uniref:hypothetical protein n=1 Tax=Kitasatospora sp. NPDC056076 TaxID=3345703 RepID=UPI0035DE8A3F
MILVEMEKELARHDWRAMPCGCGGSAEHLPDHLRQLAGVGPLGRPSYVNLEGHAWGPLVLCAPAPAVTSVALAALEGDLVPQAREWFLAVLGSVVAGEATDFESARRGLDLLAICEGVIVRGSRPLYREVMANRSRSTASVAFEILGAVEPDRARLQALREAAADWLPECCRTGRCDDYQPPRP